MENNSIEKKEVSKWNWGAFMMPVVWGFGNRSYLPLLTLIPVFGFIWMFVCGANANKWAWNNNEYRDIQEFKKVQETWNRAGFVIIALYAISIITIIIFFGTFVAMYEYVQSNPPLTY